MAVDDHEVCKHEQRLGTQTLFFSMCDKLPTKTDMRFGMPPVTDTGTRGSSAAHACCAAFAHAAKNTMQPSQRFLEYNSMQMLEGSEPGGGAPSGALWATIRAMRQFGMCPYEEWTSEMPMGDKPEQSCYAQARKHELLGVTTVAPSVESIRGAIALDFSVLVTIKIYESFTNPGVAYSGMVPVPNKVAEKCMGELTVLIVGYTNYDCFVVRNSWGQSWGLAGYCHVPVDYFSDPELMASDFVVFTSVVSFSNKRPRAEAEPEAQGGKDEKLPESEAKKPKQK